MKSIYQLGGDQSRAFKIWENAIFVAVAPEKKVIYCL